MRLRRCELDGKSIASTSVGSFAIAALNGSDAFFCVRAGDGVITEESYINFVVQTALRYHVRMKINLLYPLQSLLAGRKRSLLAAYDERRAIQREWNTHLLETHIDEETMKHGAIVLGIMQSATMIFDSESETDAFSDFLLYEIEDEDGETVVEGGVLDHAEDAQPIEREVMQAMEKASFSLFIIRECHPAQGILLIDDLLSGEKEITLVDRGISMSATPGDVFWTRLIAFPRFRMTTGAAFPFKQEDRALLLETCERILSKKIPPREQSRRLFKKIFHLHRSRGIPFIVR